MMDSSKLTSIISITVMFVGVTVIAMTFKADVDRNFGATLEVETELNKTLVEVNATLTQQIERDANLTKEETIELINQIKLIPQIAIAANDTLARIEGEQPQSNLTAQRQAVDDIRTLKEDIRQIFSIVISMNNKIDEMPFLKNVTDAPTNVFNSTQ